MLAGRAWNSHEIGNTVVCETRNDRNRLGFWKDHSLWSKEWIACGPSPASAHLWAWPSIIKKEVEQDLHVNVLSSHEALLLALLWSCFPVLPVKFLDYWISPGCLFTSSWIRALYCASEFLCAPTLGNFGLSQNTRPPTCLKRDMMKAQEFKQKKGSAGVCSLRHTIL